MNFGLGGAWPGTGPAGRGQALAQAGRGWRIAAHGRRLTHCRFYGGGNSLPTAWRGGYGGAWRVRGMAWPGEANTLRLLRGAQNG